MHLEGGVDLPYLPFIGTGVSEHRQLNLIIWLIV